MTYRGEAEVPIDGNMRWAPFCTFRLEFHFELTHIEIKVDGKRKILRFNFHENSNCIDEMIGIKLDAQKTYEYALVNN